MVIVVCRQLNSVATVSNRSIRSVPIKHFEAIHLRDKPIALARNVLDESSLLRIVFQSLSKCSYRYGQVIVFNKAPVPDRFKKLFLTYDIAPSFDQKAQNLKRSVVDTQFLAVSPKGFFRQIKFESAKCINSQGYLPFNRYCFLPLFYY